MIYFRVKLDRIKLPRRVSHGCYGTGSGRTRNRKPLRYLCYIIRMTHPDDRVHADIFKNHRGRYQRYFGPAILTDGSRPHLSAKKMCHQMRSVTNPENGNSKLKNLRRNRRRILFVRTARTTGKNNPFGGELANLIHTDRVRIHLAVDTALSHTTGDQLVVLAAEINYYYPFLFSHFYPPYRVIFRFAYACLSFLRPSYLPYPSLPDPSPASIGLKP